MTDTSHNHHGNKVGPFASKQSLRSSLWVRLRKRLLRRGVVEIDVDHHKFKLLSFLRQGIHDLMSNHPELGPKDDMSTEDHNHVLTKKYQTLGGRTVTFCSYASSVFASIRQAVGVTEDEYHSTVAPTELPYLEFISNSRSGQNFYLSHDQQYILKTEKPYYVDVFMSFLGEYLEHFQMYPHSLIVKFLGLYSVHIAGERKNVFYPPQRIETRFDIKGCLGGRYQKPHPTGAVLTVLKDQNFRKEGLKLGIQKEWFLRQLKIDVDFLRDLGVQDYSLLLGKHERHANEEDKSLREVVMRVRRTLSHPMKFTNINDLLAGADTDSDEDKDKDNEDKTKSDHPSSLTQDQLKEIAEETSSAPEPVVVPEPVVIPEPVVVPASNECTGNQLSSFTTFIGSLGSKKVEDRRLKKVSTFKNLMERSGDTASFQICNMRLLPNSKNPLHVLDSTEHRHYLGIIDFFTKYECRQRTARVLKTIKFHSTNHSSCPPDVYADRFLKFIGERVE